MQDVQIQHACYEMSWQECWLVVDLHRSEYPSWNIKPDIDKVFTTVSLDELVVPLLPLLEKLLILLLS